MTGGDFCTPVRLCSPCSVLTYLQMMSSIRFQKNACSPATDNPSVLNPALFLFFVNLLHSIQTCFERTVKFVFKIKIPSVVSLQKVSCRPSKLNLGRLR